MTRRSCTSPALPGTGGRGGSCPLAETRPAAAGPALLLLLNVWSSGRVPSRLLLLYVCCSDS
eukprot:12009331-Heterocapsa_arctica.AAC.1